MGYYFTVAIKLLCLMTMHLFTELSRIPQDVLDKLNIKKSLVAIFGCDGS